VRVALVSALIIGVGASPGLSASFKVDPAQSSLVLQIFKDGVGRGSPTTTWSTQRVFGHRRYDPRIPKASSIQVAVRRQVR